MLDAFQGLPTPDPVKDGFYEKGWGRVTRAQAEAVLWVAGVQKQVTVVEGWFEDTLPTLKGHQFCLAHLDGDLYGSTRVALEHVGPAMVDGGAVVLDDYADLGGGVYLYGGLAWVQDATTYKYGYIDREGRTVIPLQFNQAGTFENGVAKVSTLVESIEAENVCDDYNTDVYSEGEISPAGTWVSGPKERRNKWRQACLTKSN